MKEDISTVLSETSDDAFPELFYPDEEKDKTYVEDDTDPALNNDDNGWSGVDEVEEQISGSRDIGLEDDQDDEVSSNSDHEHQHGRSNRSKMRPANIPRRGPKIHIPRQEERLFRLLFREEDVLILARWAKTMYSMCGREA